MSARDELTAEFGAGIELVRSGGGVFEVTVDDRLAFSKKALGRFPEPGELKSLIASNGTAEAAPGAAGECCPPKAPGESCLEGCPT